MLHRLLLLLLHLLHETNAALFSSSLPLPGIPWTDDRGFTPPYHHLPLPSQTFLLLTPARCPAQECQGIVDMWTHYTAIYPHFLWSANCDPSHPTQRLCAQALRHRWLDKNGPQLLQWDTKTKFWAPYQGAKDPDALTTRLNKAYEKYMAQLSHHHEEGKLKLARALVQRSNGDDRPASGTVLMLTNQLPVWYNCSLYELKPGGTSGVGAQMDAMAFLAQDFFPTMKIQRQYHGGATPWYVHWSLPEHNERHAFLWRDGSRGKGSQGEDIEAAYPNRVQLLDHVEEGSSDGAHRRCLLAWDQGVGVAPAVVDERRTKRRRTRKSKGKKRKRNRKGKKAASAEPLSFEVQAGDGDTQPGTPTTAVSPRLLIELDTGRAYDWLRFRFLEFANIVAARVREKFQHHHHQAPIVVYDPVSGSCWFPMLVKAALAGTTGMAGMAVKPICSDLSSDAIAIARRDFRTNGMLNGSVDGDDADDAAVFLTGDLFVPLVHAQDEVFRERDGVGAAGGAR